MRAGPAAHVATGTGYGEWVQIARLHTYSLRRVMGRAPALTSQRGRSRRARRARSAVSRSRDFKLGLKSRTDIHRIAVNRELPISIEAGVRWNVVSQHPQDHVAELECQIMGLGRHEASRNGSTDETTKRWQEQTRILIAARERFTGPIQSPRTPNVHARFALMR